MQGVLRGALVSNRSDILAMATLDITDSIHRRAAIIRWSTAAHGRGCSRINLWMEAIESSAPRVSLVRLNSVPLQSTFFSVQDRVSAGH